MRIAILWDWHLPFEELVGDDDGVISTFRQMAKFCELRLFTGGVENAKFVNRELNYFLCRNEETLLGNLEEFHPDYIFCWGSLDRPWFEMIVHRFPEVRKGLRFAGGPHDNPIAQKFSTIFCESDSDADSLEQNHANVVRGATAVNTDLFKPIRSKKYFKSIYPTSFCGHKNIDIFADAFRGNGLVCGTQNESSIVDFCKERGILTLPRVPASAMPSLYASSHSAAATGGIWGGSQRMVLEAMACNIPPLVLDSNLRCHDYIKESGYGSICSGQHNHIAAQVDEWVNNPPKPIGRDYVLSKFTPKHYADKIFEDAECKQPA